MHLPFKLSFFDRRFEGILRKKNPSVALSLFSVARALLSSTCAVKSGEAGYGDCCHDCDDEEQSHHEDLVEGDHVHNDHNDHCTASGTGE